MCTRTISKISFTILLKLFLFSEHLMVRISSFSYSSVISPKLEKTEVKLRDHQRSFFTELHGFVAYFFIKSYLT